MGHTYTVKQILTEDEAWWRFQEEHELREDILAAVVKLLSCKNIVRGYCLYQCSNNKCEHIKRIAFTCKSKACSSCGKKATAAWIHKQKDFLPNTKWQHITFTMPDVFWDFFWTSRHLLNIISKLAAECVQSIAKRKGATPGIFIAIHTFGRDLKRNVHIHLSVALKGLSFDGTKLVDLFFSQNDLMTRWKYKIIKLFRDEYNSGRLIIPDKIKILLNHTFTFNNFLNEQYDRYWHVHCAKPTNSHQKNVEYLGKYIKRPPIAESRLTHYDGNNVVFKYLDHKTKSLKEKVLSVKEFIGRFISHIPDIGFRMIRYYGFLSSRLKKELLPAVLQLLGQKKSKKSPAPSHAQMMKDEFNVNPLECTLCGSAMLLSAIKFGITSSKKLLRFHRELALLKKI